MIEALFAFGFFGCWTIIVFASGYRRGLREAFGNIDGLKASARGLVSAVKSAQKDTVAIRVVPVIHGGKEN